MFDVGFSELIVIAIVALVVIGPERLPKVARTVGHLLGRMQRYVNDVKADISREMQIEELKKLQAELQESARNFERSVNSEIQAVQSVKPTLPDISETAVNAVPPVEVLTSAPAVTEESAKPAVPVNRV